MDILVFLDGSSSMDDDIPTSTGTQKKLDIAKEIWSKLAGEWKPVKLELLAVDCKLEQLDLEIDRILVGDQRGRVVVDLQ